MGSNSLAFSLSGFFPFFGASKQNLHLYPWIVFHFGFLQIDFTYSLTFKCSFLLTWVLSFRDLQNYTNLEVCEC